MIGLSTSFPQKTKVFILYEMKLKPKELCINDTLCLVSERLPKKVRKYFLTVIEQDQEYEVKAPMTEFRCKCCGKDITQQYRSSKTGCCSSCVIYWDMNKEI